MRFRKALRTALLAISSVLLTFLSTNPRAEECRPDMEAMPPESPYKGESPTAYKGALEKDIPWHAALRLLARPGASPSFIFRRRPNTKFDEIVTVDLGGISGFIGTRAGCSRLFDRRGQPYALPLVDKFDEAFWFANVLKPDQKIIRWGSDNDYLLVLFQRGRLVAQTIRVYTGRSGKHMPLPFCLPLNVVAVAESANGQYGLLDVTSLAEVIKPEWDGLEGRCLFDKSTTHLLYVLAERAGHKFLLDPHDGSVLMNNIDSFDLFENWLPTAKNSSAKDRAIVILRRMGEKTCRLLDSYLEPLAADEFPIRYGQCSIPHSVHQGDYLFTEEKNGAVQAYRIEIGGVRWVGSVPGTPQFANQKTGLAITRAVLNGEDVFRLYRPTGERVDDIDYSGFKDMGCGFARLQQAGRWLQLGFDGKTSTSLRYPFSC